MDADFGRTSTGSVCKKCVKKGARCSQHGGSPSPKFGASRATGSFRGSNVQTFSDWNELLGGYSSPKSPKRKSPNVLTDLPCGVLLQIARKLNPEDYFSLSEVSYEIDLCLSEGKYKTKKEKAELKMVQRKLLADQINAVTQNPHAIRNMINPSEKVQLAAVRQNGYTIEHIENPSENVQLTAVKQNGGSIRYIENPSEELKLEMVRKNGEAIQHVENPSEELQLAAVNQYALAILFIKNSSEKVKLAAASKGGYIIEYIENPSEKVQLAAVRQNGYAIEYIENPSENVQLAAVGQNKAAIRYIEKPFASVIKKSYY